MERLASLQTGHVAHASPAGRSAASRPSLRVILDGKNYKEWHIALCGHFPGTSKAGMAINEPDVFKKRRTDAIAELVGQRSACGFKSEHAVVPNRDVSDKDLRNLQLATAAVKEFEDAETASVILVRESLSRPVFDTMLAHVPAADQHSLAALLEHLRIKKYEAVATAVPLQALSNQYIVRQHGGRRPPFTPSRQEGLGLLRTDTPQLCQTTSERNRERDRASISAAHKRTYAPPCIRNPVGGTE